MPDLYPCARRLLFRLDAETAHHVTLAAMKGAEALGLLGFLSGSRGEGGGSGPVRVMGLDFPNRVGLAAGLDKKGEAVAAFGRLGFGHVEVGTVTPRPQPGNERPRLFRLVEHEAIINRMGFNNPGLEGVLANLERSRRGFGGILGVNIGKNFDTPNERALDDYLRCFEAVYGVADYVTANLSSPNTKGLRELQDEAVCRELIRRLQAKREELAAAAPAGGGRRVPLVIKIAPDLSDDALRVLGAVFSETGIDGVITTNTTLDRDSVQGHPLAAEAGGLSGGPLFEKSTRTLALLRAETDPSVALIASGGILDAEQARAKLEAGASLVQLYTGLVYRGPRLVREVAALEDGDYASDRSGVSFVES